MTVYGPQGANDIQVYTGYTMTSDPSKFGVVNNGEYDGLFKNPGKSGSIPSNWALSGRISALDNTNPAHPEQVDEDGNAYLLGVYIHRTNLSGYAGTYNNGKDGISEGCLLIAANDWNRFNKQMTGVHNFKVQVKRQTTSFWPSFLSFTSKYFFR